MLEISFVEGFVLHIDDDGDTLLFNIGAKSRVFCYNSVLGLGYLNCLYVVHVADACQPHIQDS